MNVYELRALTLEDAKSWILNQPETERQLWGWAYNSGKPKGETLKIRHLYPNVRSIKNITKETYQIEASAGKAVQYVYGYGLNRPLTSEEFDQRHRETISKWHKDYSHISQSLREWIIRRAFQAYR